MPGPSGEYVTAATLSPDGLYRYDLGRSWGDMEQMGVCWVMLNPSTADATEDDPTIRRCIAFSKAWGFGSLTVVNLFAYRATDPKALVRAASEGVDVVGPENDWCIQLAVLGNEFTVAAWGTKGNLFGRDKQVLTMLAELREPVDCLDITKGGHPKHPLYVKGDTTLRPYQATPSGRDTHPQGGE